MRGQQAFSRKGKIAKPLAALKLDIALSTTLQTRRPRCVLDAYDDDTDCHTEMPPEKGDTVVTTVQELPNPIPGSSKCTAAT